MSAQVPHSVVTAYTTENLVEIVESNEFGPEINGEMAERLIDLAARRTQSRMDNTLDTSEKDFLVMTTWDNFCRETFGSSGSGSDNVPNRFALATPNFEVSSGRDAYLFDNAVAVQQGWLETGDGRRSEIEEIDQTDTQYHDDVGEFWAPKDYTAVVGFGDDLVAPEPELADAM